MQADIIAIGDEILIGQTIDTNSAWMAQELKLVGIPIRQITSISDKKEAIEAALTAAMEKSDLILITGGLGPTQDDITKRVLTDYFEDELMYHEDIGNEIKEYFASVNRPFLEVNRQQAFLPKKARIIKNKLGTASGMWFQKNGKSIISMPGVPYEMKGLMSEIIPLLKLEFGLARFYHHTILFQGIPETVLADEIKELETEIRNKGINLSYLPSIGLIKLRFTANESLKREILHYASKIATQFPLHVYGQENDTLERVIGAILQKNNQTLGTVESCTGGAIAKRIVSVPGSSAHYKGSVVSYAYELKESLVGVSKEDLVKYGAVSQEVIIQMAQGGLKALNVDYCIATSGIAGPDGGMPNKPVGTVWVAVATLDKVYSKRFNFRQNRERNIESTVVYSLNYLRRIMLGLKSD